MHKFPRFFKLSAILLAIILLASFSTVALAVPDGDGSGPGDDPPPPDDPPPGGNSLPNSTPLFFPIWSILLPVGI